MLKKTFLGIELGSTRVKAVLIDEEYAVAAQGSFDWENKFENGIWTYSLDDVHTALKKSFAALKKDAEVHGVDLSTIAALGISAMMHGYLVFDKNDKQLVPFRTWRCTITEEAASVLSRCFNFNVPMRWSCAHFYQAVLNGEEHVKDSAFFTTLSGYVHYKLTGRKVIGIGDASGMFPIDSGIKTYNAAMLDEFNKRLAEKNIDLKIEKMMPEVLCAGNEAGFLTNEGVAFLGAEGVLKAGLPLCAPEGDAGTGMIATNSVTKRTGNVSAGTSIFAMLVLEKPLSKLYSEIDMVTTPAGAPVAMVHCNNCTGDFDGWVKLLGEAAAALGAKFEKSTLYDMCYNSALKAEIDCGALVSVNYLSGEPLTGFAEGHPLFVRGEGARFTVANLMRSLLFSTMASLRLGMDILTEKENVKVDCLLGHGGLFKTRGAGQRLMAASLGVPVAVMESAGEGGAWGAALLAAYLVQKKAEETIEDFLSKRVFAVQKMSIAQPLREDIESFRIFMHYYKGALKVERSAVENINV